MKPGHTLKRLGIVGYFVECECCGKVVLKNMSSIVGKHNHVYCSKECSHKVMEDKAPWNKQEKVAYGCECCGEIFFARINENKLYCSKKCADMVLRTSRPILGRHYREDRWNAEYRDWHNECLRRDWYHCQLCESKERLEVHHIKSYKDYPQERLNLDNGITLCKKCHLEVHNFNVLAQQ